jgi:hypothetical protein
MIEDLRKHIKKGGSMIPSPSRPIPMAENIVFSFPGDICCNCGTNENLAVIEQDTRLTRYFLGGGSEYAFRFRLPFCKSCTPSSKRRPATLLRWLLIFGLAYVISLLAITIIGIGTEAALLMEKGFIISAFAAGLFTAAWFLKSKPRQGQSSYYQPVRILKLRQEFLSGKVLGIRFGFTNEKYEREFSAMNNQAVLAKTIEVKRV